MLKKETYFVLLVFLLVVIRGSSYIFIKNIITIQSPFEIVFFRFFTTGIILLLITIKQFKRVNRYDFIFGILAGIFLFSAFAFQTYGIKYTTVSKQSFLTSLYIIFIPLFNFIFFKKKISKEITFLFFIILIGVFFISFQDFKNFEISLNLGDILTLLCALGFSLNIITLSKTEKYNVNIINITVIQMLIIGILSLIFQFIIEKSRIGFSINFSLIYLIIVCTMLNFTIQNISQKYISAHIIGLILSLESIFGTFFAVIFLNENINSNFIIGTFLITVSIVLVQFFNNKRR
ncbi:DMT family transporter [Fusobacterium animalis]|uniref:DMT family transporter n=1 Tax=Fusobacterium animalis TaxID=76859 RepID=UPI003556B4FD